MLGMALIYAAPTDKNQPAASRTKIAAFSSGLLIGRDAM
jgi:hypothetical protein